MLLHSLFFFQKKFAISLVPLKAASKDEQAVLSVPHTLFGMAPRGGSTAGHSIWAFSASFPMVSLLTPIFDCKAVVLKM